MGRLTLRVPGLREMTYRQALLADPATMAYNAGKNLGVETYDNATGCIAFPREDWRYWRQVWQMNEPSFYSAYLYDAERDCFVGEACYFYEGEHDAHTAGIVIEAKHRGRGYCAEGLRALIDHAFAREDIAVLRCDIPEDNEAALRGYCRAGFHEFGRCDGLCAMIFTREDFERGEME